MQAKKGFKQARFNLYLETSKIRSVVVGGGVEG